MDEYIPWHDEPSEDGIYIVFINDDFVRRFAARKLLMRHNGDWFHIGSDQKYRGHVYGGYGPLPAMELFE